MIMKTITTIAQKEVNTMVINNATAARMCSNIECVQKNQ